VPFARDVEKQVKEAGLRAEVDQSSGRMQAKIRNAQLQKIPYMLVIGKREAEAGAVAVRLRSGEDLGAIPVAEFVAMAKSINDSKSLELQP
jgi:threonyl-tRNA synthetase